MQAESRHDGEEDEPDIFMDLEDSPIFVIASR